MADRDITRTDVKTIVKDEIDRFVTKELENEMVKAMRTGKFRNNINDAIKSALVGLYRFMWIRKDVWKNELTK